MPVLPAGPDAMAGKKQMALFSSLAFFQFVVFRTQGRKTTLRRKIC
jgi:hypothetical protein